MSETLIFNRKINLYAQMCRVCLLPDASFNESVFFSLSLLKYFLLSVISNCAAPSLLLL